MPTQQRPERLTPLAAKSGVRALYGDIHNHCNISYGHGSLEEALANARAQLDFVSVTGHAYWPDIPVDDPSVADIVAFHEVGFAKLKRVWPDHFKTLAKYDDPGRFVVFPGYEMHSNAHGDYTIVLKGIEPSVMPKGITPAELLQALRTTFGNDAFAFPHHIGYRTGARGINWDSFDETLSPVVELISMHGSAETSLTGRPFLHSMGPCDGGNTIHAGWQKGHVFGVIGNTDHHSGFPGSYGHGRGCVYATDMTRDAIWSGIRARHTNALTGDNIHLFARLEDAMSGDLMTPCKTARLQIEAIGGSFIDSIDVIRSGRIAHRITPDLTPRAVDETAGAFETLLVVEFGWGRRGGFHDWTGEISVANGTIMGIEPRFRGPEIVSPLEGSEPAQHRKSVSQTEQGVAFDIRAYGNPNNSTPCMQGMALRVRLEQDAEIRLQTADQSFAIPASRLHQGAVCGNLGPIDSPAFRFHPLPKPHQWQWKGEVILESLGAGEWVNLHLRQTNGQSAWSSAIFIR